MAGCVARLFASEGAEIALSGRDQKTLDEAIQTIAGEVIGIRSDVSKLADIEKLYTATVKKWGKIDILFANAGIGKFASVSEVMEAHILTRSSTLMLWGKGANRGFAGRIDAGPRHAASTASPPLI